MRSTGDKVRGWALAIWSGLALLYLFIPIFIVVLFSFNDNQGRFNFTWQGFTLSHWADPFANPDLAVALKNSVLIALIGLWPPLSAARIAYALGFALAFDASLGYNGYVYPFLHTFAFPYRGLRVPARMAILVGLSLSILVGFGAARIATLSRRRWLVTVCCS